MIEVFNYSGLGDYRNYVKIDSALMRPTEVPYLLGDCSKAKEKLNWSTEVDMKTLAQMMYDSDLANES